MASLAIVAPMASESRFTLLLSGQIHVRGGEGDDEEIARIATRQHGVVGRRQLLELGVGGCAIDHRLAVGRLRWIHAGVYGVGHEALAFEGRVLAAVMCASPGAAASHMSAAALDGLCEPGAGPIHVTATAARKARPGLVLHRGLLRDNEVRNVKGIPTTTIDRTLLDLGSLVSTARLRRLVKVAEFQRLTTFASLAAILERYPRRQGRVPLARLVAESLNGMRRTRSELEDRFLGLCRRRELPLPETNVELETASGRVEVDCVWPGRGVIVELDGLQAHGGLTAFEDDRARDRALVAAGWTVIRVTWAHLHRDGAILAADIRAALERGGFTKVDPPR